ncbi:MAG: class I SAM-dependent methyltransferase [Candidatus Omnitrophica bacterium]|nr:class I SAM-dependent methyltransferase [Candidatus Omnitrophota bacterium]
MEKNENPFISSSDEDLKNKVREHWQNSTCGTRYGTDDNRRGFFEQIEEARYKLEPFILELADFSSARDLKVLEIGVGAGTDFLQWNKNGADASGVDLTQAAIDMTRERLEINGFSLNKNRLQVADAENLPFADESFDVVYSYGVLHHTPNTQKAFEETFRVLKKGGVLKAMIYHVPSWVGLYLWVKNAFLKGKFLKSIKQVIYEDLESIGTKAYTVSEAESMLVQAGYSNIKAQPKLSPGDLLTISPSYKYQSFFYKIVWKIYPRFLVQWFGDQFGLYMLINAKK